VAAAERIRAAECEKRGPNCRTRETEEQTKCEDLAKAPAVRETSVGKTLGSLFVTTCRFSGDVPTAILFCHRCTRHAGERGSD